MTKEEFISQLTQERAGRTPHYNVPEGYFDDFPARMMDRIQTACPACPVEEPSRFALLKMRWFRITAAVACLSIPVITGVQLYLSNNEDQYDIAFHELSEAEYDEAMEMAGIDNNVIEAYLIEKEYGEPDI